MIANTIFSCLQIAALIYLGAATIRIKGWYSMGRRWIFLRRVNVCFDIGYGIPIFTDYKWSQGKPTNGDQLESLATIVYGLTSEISLGFAF